MGTSVEELAISNSYIGILRISSDENGFKSSPSNVYSSNGTASCFSLGTNSATFTGTLTTNTISATGISATGTISAKNITASGKLSTKNIEITGTTTFTANVIFSCTKVIVNSETALNVNGATTFKDTVSFSGATTFETLTVTKSIDATSTDVTLKAPVTCNSQLTAGNFKTNSISAATTSGSITFKSPVACSSSLTVTGAATFSGSSLTINSSTTKLNTSVTCSKSTVIDMIPASSVTVKTQPENNNSTLVANTAYVDRAINKLSLLPDYSSKVVLTVSLGKYQLPVNALVYIVSYCGQGSDGWLKINGNTVYYYCLGDGDYGYTSDTILVKANTTITWGGSVKEIYYFPLK